MKTKTIDEIQAEIREMQKHETPYEKQMRAIREAQPIAKLPKGTRTVEQSQRDRMWR